MGFSCNEDDLLDWVILGDQLTDSCRWIEHEIAILVCGNLLEDVSLISPAGVAGAHNESRICLMISPRVTKPKANDALFPTHIKV